jgi:hypothetical protein
MLSEEVYWAIIDSSLHETTNQEDQELFLVSAIEKLTSRNDRISFKNRQTPLTAIIQNYGVQLIL